jgi:hypothetical protein
VNATRTIPGRPIRSAADVADAIVDLIASTVDASPHIDTDEVRSELAAAVPALALLASGGHLVGEALVLTAADLRLVINVPVGEAALAATENIAAPRGAATATDWSLHLPTPGGMAALAKSAASACTHVSIDPAPTATARSEAATSPGIDLTRLLDRSDR